MNFYSGISSREKFCVSYSNSLLVRKLDGIKQIMQGYICFELSVKKAIFPYGMKAAT
jgi:hypothetical protein